MPSSKLYSIGFHNMVVLEDEDTTFQDVSKSLRRRGVRRVYKAPSIDAAVNYAERRLANGFILDIHMGVDREQEGLDALEKIKSIDSDIFVGILSAHEGYFRKMATRLGADVYCEKSANREKDIDIILSSWLVKTKILIENLSQQIDPFQVDSPEKDKNFIEFIRLSSKSDWLKRNMNKYVVFVHGKFIASGEDKGKLLRNVRDKYPNSSIFLEFVDLGDKFIELPSPIFIGDMELQ